MLVSCFNLAGKWLNYPNQDTMFFVFLHNHIVTKIMSKENEYTSDNTAVPFTIGAI
jgi:hypothetical protein